MYQLLHRYQEQKTYNTQQRVKLLRRLGELALEEIRKEIDQTDLSDKDEIKRSLKMRVSTDTVKVWSDHQSFYLDQGVAPHKMRYVNNRVIPIDLKSVRHVTERDRKAGVAFRMIKGSPSHPGHEKLDFVSKGIQRAQVRFSKEVLSDDL